MPLGVRLQVLLQYMGANLVRLRLQARRTQAEMAEHLECSMRYYQKLERGEAVPSIPLVVHLAQVLGVDECELFVPRPMRRPRPGRPRKNSEPATRKPRRR